MTDFYLVLVIILFALAITDLVVGVSNDAVNFLNSAIGAKVAPLRWVMVVASVGIFIGAGFSQGMMEVARKGVFHPEAFSFAEIMILFLAVMLTDVILLDVFNSLGLPTSTTVSIVFELLGASVALALIKMTHADLGLSHLDTFINGSSALKIITGILLSVVVAFAIGALIMYFSRLLFSFQYKKRMKYVGGVWGGLAMAAMTYFLLIKGLKHAAFIDAATTAFIKENTLLILGASFAFFTLVLQAISMFTKWNTLKFLVLFGTFALAMAFAGNDLVNFIGVPIAGLQSYLDWSATSADPSNLMMSSLAEPVATPGYLLLIAGGVMVVTLWFSKKARNVVETSVKLSRQDEGTERFQPNFLSRALVRTSYAISNALVKAVPNSIQDRIERNFKPAPQLTDKGEAQAFDLIRASVNLAVASMLISFATSLKLPLSTTYVTFMVAMGASLADRAWGRDSAVFRVAGVVQVVAGWFGTALVAFSISAIFATLIYFFEIYAVAGLVALAAFLVIRSNFFQKDKTHQPSELEKTLLENDEIDPLKAESLMKSLLGKILISVRETHDEAVEGLMKEDRSKTKKALKKVLKLKEQNDQLKANLFQLIKKSKREQLELNRQIIKMVDLQQDLLQSTELIAQACSDHIENVHSPLAEEQARLVIKLLNRIRGYLNGHAHALNIANKSEAREPMMKLWSEKNQLLQFLDETLDRQSVGIRGNKFNSRNTMLLFTLVLETRDLLAVAHRSTGLFVEGFDTTSIGWEAELPAPMSS